MANSTRAPGRKSSMMERLRRLRTSSTSAKPQDNNAVRRPAAAAPANRVKPALKPPQPRHYDEGLDLEMVNSKLELYARECSPAEQEATLKEGPGLAVARGTGKTGNEDAKGTETSAASQRSVASTCPSIVIHPPDGKPAEDPQPPDFQLFLKQARDHEQARQKQGHTPAPRPAQELSRNPFYSSSLPAPASPNAPKLAEIQEAREGGDGQAAVANGGAHATTGTKSTAAPSTRRTESTTSSGSNDFAETDTQPTRNTASLGRHVSFREPARTKRAEAHTSAYHGRHCESPDLLPSIGKRESMRKMLRKCIGQH